MGYGKWGIKKMESLGVDQGDDSNMMWVWVFSLINNNWYCIGIILGGLLI
ncbi:hypothetical protein HanRHA438_Chr12g0546641 [Helianthus annuus]|nr:hypothetical protein HanRHA438_Chr12g0546641 [Helianthus annuus]